MRGGGVEVVINLFHVLAVIPLPVRQTKESLLENGVAPIPEGERQAKVLLIIRPARDPIFTPPISPTAGVIMRKISPSITAGAIILTNRTPLAFRNIRPPAPPTTRASLIFSEACEFRDLWRWNGGVGSGHKEIVGGYGGADELGESPDYTTKPSRIATFASRRRWRGA